MKVASQVERRTEAHVDDWLGLAGARVLVAGAGGLGAACVAGYADQGASVLVVDHDAECLSALAAGDRVQTLRADVTAPGAGRKIVAEATGRLGGLDVFVHCVGTNDRRPVLDLSEQDWARIIDLNLNSAFSLAQAAGAHMVTAGRGRIVLLSSVSGWLAHAHHAPYAASKGGLNQMMRVMAREWAPVGVGVNAVAPGYVETPLTADYLSTPGNREFLTALVPAGRLGTPDEVVGSVLFLSSERSAFVTGHVLFVDGGRSLV